MVKKNNSQVTNYVAFGGISGKTAFNVQYAVVKQEIKSPKNTAYAERIDF